MNNTQKLAVAALSGLLTAGFTAAPAMAAANPYPQGYNPQSYKIASAEEKGPAMEKAMEKHACKGMNSCKGNGGCKTGDNGCKGKNSCKGKGGCATDGSKPAGQ